MELVIKICDICGHYCSYRDTDGRVVTKPNVVEIMMQGVYMHACEPGCSNKPGALTTLLQKRVLIAEQNANLDMHPDDFCDCCKQPLGKRHLTECYYLAGGKYAMLSTVADWQTFRAHKKTL